MLGGLGFEDRPVRRHVREADGYGLSAQDPLGRNDIGGGKAHLTQGGQLLRIRGQAINHPPFGCHFGNAVSRSGRSGIALLAGHSKKTRGPGGE